jgi:fucose permease
MHSSTQTSRKYLMGTACAGLFTFGVMTSFLGATLPELSARLGFDLARAGALPSFLYLPQIPMVFLAGPLIDRFGKRPVLAGGLVISAAALLGVAYAPVYSVLATLLVLLGLGGCSAMSGSNTLIPDLYPENPSSALNLGNIFFGLGAISLPLLLALAARLGLVPTLWLMALLVAGVALVAFSETFPAASAQGGFDFAEARRVATNPAVILLAWVLFFYSAIEITTALFTRTFLEQEFSAPAQASKTILTAFWVALMVGRLAASQVVKKVRGSRVVLGASVGAVVGLSVLAIAPNVTVATVGILVCGLSYAPVFPTTAGTASTYFPKLFGTVFGTLMTLALLSGVILPPAIGYVAKAATLRAAIGVMVACAVFLFVMQALFVAYERRKLIKVKV